LEGKMNIKELIPWSQSKRETPMQRDGDDPFRALQSEVNRVFENFWHGMELPTQGMWDTGLGRGTMPRVDVRETGKEIEVVAELPGMDKSDVDVSVADGALIIRGEKKAERETEDKGYMLRERSFGRVERVLPLPEGLDLDSVKAKFKNGVLTVTMPRTAEAQSAVKRIPVQH
jgi:HSP20 family protein